MHVGSMSSSLVQAQAAQTRQQLSQVAARDADGDNDGSRAGEVEATEGNANNTGSLGSNLDVTA